LEENWPYAEKFDFIHSRNSFFRKPVHMISSAYHALKPGGVLEMQEFIPILQCNDKSWNNTSLEEWTGLLTEGTKKLGLDWRQNEKYVQWMEDQGFEKVNSKRFVWPTNTWAKDIALKRLGICFNRFLTSDLEGMSMWILTQAFGWKKEEVIVLCARVRNDLNNCRIHAYADVYVVSIVSL
jgi:hypothetical protein